MPVKPSKQPAKQPDKDTTLEALFPAPNLLETSIGVLEFNPYKLKDIAQITKYLGDIAQTIQVTDLSNLQGLSLENINIPYLFYALGDNNSACLKTLIRCSTGADEAKLGELSTAETFLVLKKTFEVAVMPMFKELGNALGGLSPAQPSGPTQ